MARSASGEPFRTCAIYPWINHPTNSRVTFKTNQNDRNTCYIYHYFRCLPLFTTTFQHLSIGFSSWFSVWKKNPPRSWTTHALDVSHPARWWDSQGNRWIISGFSHSNCEFPLKGFLRESSLDPSIDIMYMIFSDEIEESFQSISRG